MYFNKNNILIIILLFPFILLGQNQITGYQYAFNNGTNLTYVAITPTTDFHLQTDIDVSSLTHSLNQIHIRFKDSNGQWSSFVSQMFITNPQMTQNQDVKITGYEYYYNDDVAGKQFVPVNPQDDFHLIDDFDVSNLTNAINQIHIRFKDSNGQWSSIVSQMFITNPQMIQNQDVKITGYEYYYNDDVAGKQFVPVNPQDDFHLIDDFDVSNLTDAINQIHIRFKDSNGQWSSIVSQMFITNPQTAQNQDVKITGYEYYYNNNVAGKQFVPVNPQDNFHLIDDFDVSNLPHTINQIHIRFLDDNGQWSAMLSKTFMRNPTVTTLTDNKLVSYEYWVDDDTANMQEIAVQPAVQDLHILDLDMRMYWRGQHVLHSRYKDEQGVYSLVTTDTIVKLPLPYPVFEMTNTEICAGETVDFANFSVDFDTVLWDFDDGTTSTDIDPSHTFTQAGTYQINLHITETATGQTADLQHSLIVHPLPANTVSSSSNLPACFGETVTLTADATGMSYVWSNGETTQSIDVTTAGTYSVQLTNPTTGCQVSSDDINVSFYPAIDNTVTYDANTYQLTAVQIGATYQWLDCDNNYNPIPGATNQSFIPQQSGNYAVEITLHNCSITSDCQTVTIVGIDDYQLSGRISIYPNPAQQFIIIETELPSLQIHLYNLAGQELWSQKIQTGKSNRLNLSKFSSGVYFIKLKVLSGNYKNQTISKRLIIK